MSNEHVYMVRVSTPVCFSENGAILEMDVCDYQFASRDDAVTCINSLHEQPVANFSRLSLNPGLSIPQTTAIPLNFDLGGKAVFFLEVGDITPEMVDDYMARIRTAIDADAPEPAKLSPVVQRFS